jgi:hypothetical protein
MRVDYSKDYRDNGWMSDDASPDAKEAELRERERLDEERRKTEPVPTDQEIDAEVKKLIFRTLRDLNTGKEVSARTIVLLKEWQRTRMVLDSKAVAPEQDEGEDALLDRLRRMAEGDGEESSSNS